MSKFFTTSRKCFLPKIKGKRFPENQAKFSFDGKCFLLTEKCFLLTNFSNDKQTQESLENDSPKTTFQETNIPYAEFFFLAGFC
jgi:hypothetical protein